MDTVIELLRELITTTKELLRETKNNAIALGYIKAYIDKQNNGGS